ncbi:MAG: hypothetical protein AB7I19_07035 [Planctomycetota bacterium]
MAVPPIEEQTDRRRPRRLVRIGGFLVAGSGLLAGRLWEFGAVVALPLPLGLIAVGLACLWTGGRGLVRAARLERELARAMDTEGELRALLSRSDRDDTARTRALVERGFRDPQIRRWIVRRFAKPSATQAAAVDTRQAMKPQ